MRVMHGDQPLLIDGQPVLLLFDYHPELPARDVKRGKRGLGCILRRPGVAGGPPPEVLGSGLALCAKEDKFDKEIGRVHALRAALANSGLPRETRGQIWEFFRTTVRQPPSMRPQPVHPPTGATSAAMKRALLELLAEELGLAVVRL